MTVYAIMQGDEIYADRDECRADDERIVFLHYAEAFARMQYLARTTGLFDFHIQEFNPQWKNRHRQSRPP